MQSIESSGNSIIYISKHIVFQKFYSKKVAIRIVNIISNLQKYTTYNIIIQNGFGKFKNILFKHRLHYETFNYIVPLIYYFHKENIITWKKISPLNMLSYGLSKQFLKKNSLKICYDISKALIALRKNNIFHNDTVLDNIGIYNGNFILFDFDGSGDKKYCQYTQLTNSFLFYNVNINYNLTGIHSIILYVSHTHNINLSDSFLFLESLKIYN